MASKKSCFIICPIGKSDSEERKWADFVRSNIIEPAVTECGYEKPARSDDPDIGLLMVNIIERMFEADLVVADLTYYEPNVFFELGIRHCAKKPVIHLIKAGEEIPFDLADNKAIFLDKDYDKVLSTRVEIKQRIESIQKNPTQFYSQVQQYIELKQFKLFEEKQTGKDKITLELLGGLVKALVQIKELISNLHKELVEKPKQLPRYGQTGALQQAALRVLAEWKKASQKSPIEQALEETEEELSQEDERKE